LLVLLHASEEALLRLLGLLLLLLGLTLNLLDGKEPHLWLDIRISWEDLSVELIWIVISSELGNIGMGHYVILRSILIDVWIMHWGRILRIKLPIVQPHHLIVMHRVHVV
jgi:hypothetical protein